MNLIKRILVTISVLLMIIFFQNSVVKAATVEVTTETLNLREKASTDSDIVALISEGDECEILEDEGDWYRVKYGEYTGYISKEYTKLISDDSSDNSNTDDSENENSNTSNNDATESNSNSTDNNSEEDNSIESNTIQQDNTNTNNTDAKTGEGTINSNTELRITPLINSSVIENVKSGAKVTVINQINGWSYIYTDESAGWIRSDAVTVEGQEETNNSNEEKTDSSEETNSTSTNEEETTQEETQTSQFNFQEKTMYTNDSAVNIRSAANTNADIIMVVGINTELKVIDEDGDWYKVETSQGDAYVSKDLLSNKRTSVTTDRGSGKTTTRVEAEAKASTSSSVKGKEIVSYAKKFLGVPYVYGGATPSGFDCSGFTMYVYEKFGISMPHGAQSQARLGKKVTTNKNSKSSILNNLKTGDLVFFLDYETMDEIGHCGIYIGSGKFIHASSGSGYCVKIDNLLPGNYYNTRYCAARRVI